MTGRYKAYSDYKESGVDWIPNIPFSWKVTSLRHLISSVRNGSTETQLEKSEELVAISRIETISTGEINMDKTGFVNPKLIPESFKLNVGDLLLSHINSLPMVGNVAQVQKNHLIYHGMNLLRLIPKDSDSSRYLYWQLKSDYSRRAIESIAKPAINQASVSTESLKALQLLCPSIAEQQKIASFLDHETAKIDTLIAKQEKLIELLKEKRQAVISHAVTKGLNPNAPMRDSGVEWLGEVPEHWLIGSLRWKVSISSGEGLSSNLVEKNKTELKKIPVIGGNGVMGFSESSNTHKTAIAIGRVGALCGNVHLINYISWITDNALKISSWDGFDENYLISLLKAANLNDLASTTAQPLITGEQIKSLIVVIPPLKEQIKINLKLTKIVNLFDKLEKRSKDGINLLKERKTALISAAVTGKIDVRDFVSEQGQPQGI